MASTSLRLINHRIWLTVLGFGFACLVGSSAAHAQQTGSSVNECSSGIVDSSTGVEQTVCLYGDQSGLTGTVEVDCCTGNSWYWADGEGTSGYINSTYIADQCCANQESVWGFVVPQINTWYYLTGYYDENICDGDDNCNWSYGNSGLWVSVEVTGAPPPAAPTGLSATPGNGQVALTWAASSGATSYNVYEGSSPGGESSNPIATGIAGTSYTVTGLNNGTTYYFTVVAVSSSGVSGYSNEASATPTILIYSYSANYDGTGSVTSYNDLVNGTWTNVAYDNLSRLAAATWTPVSGSQESFCWTYDNFGNVTAEAGSNQPFANSPGASACQVASGATLLSNNWSAYSSFTGNNHVTATSLMSAGPLNYDAAGNVQSDNLNEYAYDGEGRICAIENLYSGAVTQYIYDADGNRVAKGTAHTILVSGVYVLSCDPTQNGFTATHLYVIGPSGEQLTETDGQGNWKHTNVYLGGELTATYDADPSSGTKALHFHFSDWLGTRRAQTDYAGNVEETCISWPFGDQLNCQQTTLATADDATEHHFTGKERDAESGNDYFGARYYASSMGRFLSPDPENFGANIMNPQSWNMYSYAGNNPLINIDPDGRECVWDDGSYDAGDDPDTGSADKCSGQGGTWISNDIFENRQGINLGDWSGDANSSLSGLVGDIQSCSAAVGGGQAAGLIVADSFASGFSNDQTAYALGTASYESGPGGMGSHMTEMGSPSYFSQYDGRMGNTSPGDGSTYRGRGYVQLTGKWSYNYWTNQIGQNLVQHPSLAATPDTAAEIMVEGMDRGSFRSGNSIQDYVNSSGSNFVGARAVVNGGGDQAQTIANAATGFSNSMSGCR